MREGGIANFVVKRTNGTGTATVHWELREQGSAAAANADYGYGTASQPQTGDLTFAAGETQKTISIQTFGDGTPEPDETFGIHLSHPTNVPIARADATGTILNDDYDFQSVSPTVLPEHRPDHGDPARRRPDEPDVGEAALQLRAQRPDQRGELHAVRRRPVGHGRVRHHRPARRPTGTGTSSSTPSTTPTSPIAR